MYGLPGRQQGAYPTDWRGLAPSGAKRQAWAPLKGPLRAGCVAIGMEVRGAAPGPWDLASSVRASQRACLCCLVAMSKWL